MSFAAKVAVYVTDYCPYCTQAKALLDKKGVVYDTIDVTGDDQKRAWLVKATGRRTVPQIFINDRPVGGCDDLYALDRGGKLEPMLREAAPA
jgi:glutaredoxin 3